jgi:hypothetical protein
MSPVAPCFALSVAHARPMPLEAPVIHTTLPGNRDMRLAGVARDDEMVSRQLRLGPYVLCGNNGWCKTVYHKSMPHTVLCSLLL